MTGPRRPWASQESAELPRPYTVTGGRTCPSREMDRTTQFRTRAPLPDGTLAGRTPEEQAVARLCAGGWLSVGEVAARLRHPVQVVKILLADLLEANAVVMTTARPSAPDITTLEDVLAALHKLPV